MVDAEFRQFVDRTRLRGLQPKAGKVDKSLQRHGNIPGLFAAVLEVRLSTELRVSGI